MISGLWKQIRKSFPKKPSYDELNLDSALEHVSNLQADLGGTEILAPLQYVISLPRLFDSSSSNPILPHDASRRSMQTPWHRQIFLLTDGLVSDVTGIISWLAGQSRESRDEFRIFTVGVGDNVSRHLVQGIARAGKGTCQFITDDEDETQLSVKVLSQLREAIRPHLREVTIGWGALYESPSPSTSWTQNLVQRISSHLQAEGKQHDTLWTEDALPAPVHLPAIRVAPHLRPPLHSGSQFALFALLSRPPPSHPPTIGVTARTPDGRLMAFELPISRTQGKPIIHQLAARALIRDLEEGVSPLGLAEEPKIRQEMVSLAIRHGICCSQTSFVAYAGAPVRSSFKCQPSTSSRSAAPVRHKIKCGGSGNSARRMRLLRAQLERQQQRTSTSAEDKEETTEEEASSEGERRTDCRLKRQNAAINFTPLLSFLGCQLCSGEFPLNERLASAIGPRLSQAELSNANPDCSAEVWGSVVALVALAHLYPGSRDQWDLCAEKTRKWLLRQRIGEARQQELEILAARIIFPSSSS